MCNYTYYRNFLAFDSSCAHRRQSGVLRFLPERKGASRGVFASRGDRHFPNAAVLAFMDLNETVANKPTQVPGQCGPLETLELREARGRNRAGLNQRRQQGELRASNARPSHGLFEGARQISTPAARGGAHALPGGDEVDLLGLHITCIYTFAEPSRRMGGGRGNRPAPCPVIPRARPPALLPRVAMPAAVPGKT
jgi:hypothetical protein